MTGFILNAYITTMSLVLFSHYYDKVDWLLSDMFAIPTDHNSKLI